MKRLRFSLNAKILLLAFACMICGSMLLSWLSLAQYRENLRPALEQKTATIGSSINTVLTGALGYGIPLQKLQGVNEYLDEMQKTNPEIVFLSVSDDQGRLLYRSQANGDIAGAPAISPAIDMDGQRIGQIDIHIDPNYVEKKIAELTLDIGAVVVVSVTIAFELLLFVVAFNISSRLEAIRTALARFNAAGECKRLSVEFADELGRFVHGLNGIMEKLSAAAAGRMAHEETATKSGGVDYIRWPFFLLIASDSMTLSFFPLYVDQLYTPIWGMSREFIVSLPISLFMLVWALSLPFGGAWSDAVGRRRAFVVGAVVTAVGLVLAGFASSILDLLLWRSITAIGYSLVFITVQGYITDHTLPQNRSRGMATFVTTFFAGSMAGAAIGGILADRVGMNVIFVGSGLLSLAAALFVARFIARDKPAAAKPKLKLSDFKIVCVDRDFLMVTFFSAIPSKIALTGFLYYSAPILLNILGSTQSTAGRVMMLYGLVIIILSPMVAYLSDKLRSRSSFILLGSLMAAIAVSLIYFETSVTTLMISIFLLGLGHAIGVPTQLTLITEINPELSARVGVGTVVGIFRLMERAGNLIGPMLAALLIGLLGYSSSFLFLSILLGLCTVVLAIYLALKKRAAFGQS